MPQDGDLYIRYSATDHGERDLPAATVYWESPAVEVIGSGLGSGVAVAGATQSVRVYVGNRSATNAHTDVRVQVYAANWGAMNPYLDSMGGNAGVEIGPQTVVAGASWDPLPGTEGVFEVGWTPDPTELGGAASLHVCLQANVYAAGDGVAQSSPPVFTDILTEQHHAQHNITLDAAPTLMPHHFSFFAGNALAEGDEFVLELAEMPGPLDAADTFHLAGAHWLVAAQKRLRKPLAPLKPSSEAVLASGKQRGRALKLALEAGEQVPVTLETTGKESDQPGLRRFRLIQRCARTGAVVGGARLITAVVPQSLIPKPLLRERG